MGSGLEVHAELMSSSQHKCESARGLGRTFPFRGGLQGDGSIVLLQPSINLVVGERHLAQSLVGALLQWVCCLFAL